MFVCVASDLCGLAVVWCGSCVGRFASLPACSSCSPGQCSCSHQHPCPGALAGSLRCSPGQCSRSLAGPAPSRALERHCMGGARLGLARARTSTPALVSMLRGACYDAAPCMLHRACYTVHVTPRLLRDASPTSHPPTRILPQTAIERRCTLTQMA